MSVDWDKPVMYLCKYRQNGQVFSTGFETSRHEPLHDKIFDMAADGKQIIWLETEDSVKTRFWSGQEIGATV